MGEVPDSNDEPLQGLVEGPESPPKPSFPLVGMDRTPTPEMIAQGRVGNGSLTVTETSLEAAYELHHQQIKQEKDERRRFFNENAKDALLDSIRLHHAMVKRGLDVMERIETPNEEKPVTGKDMQILSLAQKSAKEIADRGMGKSKTSEEEVETNTLLSLITVKRGS